MNSSQLIHGAGSFGHFQAKDYAVSRGNKELSGKPEEGCTMMRSLGRFSAGVIFPAKL